MSRYSRPAPKPVQQVFTCQISELVSTGINPTDIREQLRHLVINEGIWREFRAMHEGASEENRVKVLTPLDSEFERLPGFPAQDIIVAAGVNPITVREVERVWNDRRQLNRNGPGSFEQNATDRELEVLSTAKLSYREE